LFSTVEKAFELNRKGIVLKGIVIISGKVIKKKVLIYKYFFKYYITPEPFEYHIRTYIYMHK